MFIGAFFAGWEVGLVFIIANSKTRILAVDAKFTFFALQSCFIF